MSDTPRGPRVILEEAERTSPRLDFEWEQTVVPVAAPVVAPKRTGRWSGVTRVVAGLALLVFGLAALDAANYVTDQFARGLMQGWLTLGVVLAGFGLLASGALWEVRGLLAIRAVDRAREAFARNDLATARLESVRWAGGVAEAAPLQPALREAKSIEELRHLLESGPLKMLDQKTVTLGRSAAVQSFAITAVSPSPGLDVLVFGWRGVRLVRQVAALHGLRPGMVGTFALLRRTLMDAATVAVTDVAVDTAARALLSNKLLEQFAGEAAAGAVAARRMLRLARVSAEACRILPARR